MWKKWLLQSWQLVKDNAMLIVDMITHYWPTFHKRDKTRKNNSDISKTTWSLRLFSAMATTILWLEGKRMHILNDVILIPKKDSNFVIIQNSVWRSLAESKPSGCNFVKGWHFVICIEIVLIPMQKRHKFCKSTKVQKIVIFQNSCLSAKILKKDEMMQVML